jgi:hypothetical protein
MRTIPLFFNGVKTVMACKDITVEISFLTNDNKHVIDFALNKTCNTDDSAVWAIDFKLKEDKNGSFITRISVHVVVGKAKEAKAEALANTLDTTEALPKAKADLLLGPIASRSLQLPAGANNDAKLKSLVGKMVG